MTAEVLGEPTKSSSLYPPLAHSRLQFRLLTVEAGHSDLVRCRLETWDLYSHRRPDYETISYCWGDEADRSCISVNGNLLGVHASSASALERIRLQDSPRTVWIDAVCINQADNSDRSYQVAMMRDIYANGTGNLVYLGDEPLGDAFDTVLRILKEVHAHEILSKVRDIHGGIQKSARNVIQVPYNHEDLRHLYANPWFSRVWVLQEVILSKKNTCLCRLCQIDLLDLGRVAAALKYNSHWVDVALAKAVGFAAQLYEIIDNQSCEPLELFSYSRDRHTSRPVDRIYGMLGLMKGPVLTPDYSKRTIEVYCDVARWAIWHHQSLSVLEYVYHSSSPVGGRQDRLPSWVPDWSRPYDYIEDATDFGHYFDASNGGRYVPRLDLGDELQAPGVLLGYIAAHATYVRAGYQDADFTKVNGLLATTLSAKNLTQKQKQDVFIITVCAGYDSQHRAFRTNSFPKEYDLPGATVAEDMDQSVQTFELPSEHQRAAMGAGLNRRFFVGTNGLVGVGPRTLQEGDIAVVLYGLAYPAILRPVGTTFVYLGLAYVYGVMSGEAVRKHHESHRPDSLFNII